MNTNQCMQVGKLLETRKAITWELTEKFPGVTLGWEELETPLVTEQIYIGWRVEYEEVTASIVRNHYLERKIENKILLG